MLSVYLYGRNSNRRPQTRPLKAANLYRYRYEASLLLEKES